MEILNKDGAAPMVNPREFNGQWFFTNPDTEDFTPSWNGTPYTFPAMSTSPLVIMDANPLETQNIRKVFAYKLAQRMFGKTAKYKKMEKDSAGRPSPVHFDPAIEYEPFVQQCLSPLPVGETKIGKKTQRTHEVHKDPKTGKPVIKVLGDDDQGSTSLVDEALQA